MRQPRFAIIEAPSVLGTALAVFPEGVETLPDALLAAGLAERLGARRAGRVEPPTYDGRRDPETQLLNPHGVATYSVALADAVGGVIDTGEFPVVLGGDCSIMLGCLLALRRRRRNGLLFIDGHADFYQPEVQPYGEAAAMELALATGRGPDVVTDMERRGPLVRDADILISAIPGIPPFVEIVGTLGELAAAGFRLAIVSNTDDAIIAGNVAQLGGHIHQVITAEQARSYKPARHIFDHAWSRLDVHPDHLVHICASPYADLTAARELGFRTVWIDRGTGRQPVPDYTPDATVATLDEVPELFAAAGWM